MKLSLQSAWKKRAMMYADGGKLLKKGYKLQMRGCEIWEKGSKLCTEGNKIRTEMRKLWVEAVLKKFGSITIKWKYIPKKGYRCTLENGEVYEP